MPDNPRKILLVCATEAEMPKVDFEHVDKLVAGIGMVATTYTLTKQLASEEYDIVLNVGIAGSFHRSMELGTVVQVGTELMVELGVENHGEFIPADEMGLMASNEMRFKTTEKVKELQLVNGITVNRVHGSDDSIARVVNQFNPDVESMEGAAVAYVCQQFEIPWVQLRAISNHVEPRNREAWDVPLALKNLHKSVLRFLEHEA